MKQRTLIQCDIRTTAAWRWYLCSATRETVVGTAAQATSALASRLNQLGFRPKAQVDVIRRAPLGDPTIYRVQDTELCLRRREAQLIEVVPEPG